MPQTPLGDVVHINPRIPKADIDETQDVSFVAMASVTDDGRIVHQETRKIKDTRKGYTYFQRGDILLAKITPCFENGKAALTEELEHQIGFGSTEFHVLRPNASCVETRYLFYIIWSPRFRFIGQKAMYGAAGQKRVPVEFLRKYKIPLPSLREQKRIAAILDKADAIRRKRQQAIQLADEFLRSVFLDMFGRDLSIAEVWPVSSIQTLLADVPNAIRTGPFGSQLKHSEFTTEGVPVLGIDNIVTNSFRWATKRCLPEERLDEFKRYLVRANDVIVTIMGTTGRVAVAPDDLPTCMSTKHLCVMTLDRKKVDPYFLWATLVFDQRVRHQAKVSSGGAIMEGWNMGIIKSLSFPLPPLKKQLKFRRVLEQQQHTQRTATSAARDSSDLFDSVAQRAFRGDL